MDRFKVLVQENAGKLWFPVFVGACCALDTFIPVVPNDFLIAAAVMAQPHNWLFCAVAQTLGITLGSSLFCLIALYNPDGIKQSYPSVFESSTWETTEEYFNYYGSLSAMIGGAVLPIHPFLFVGALSGFNMLKLIFALTLGRFGRNFAVCYFTAQAQGLYRTKTKDE